jgi:hypothetical protein
VFCQSATGPKHRETPTTPHSQHLASHQPKIAKTPRPCVYGILLTMSYRLEQVNPRRGPQLPIRTGSRITEFGFPHRPPSIEHNPHTCSVEHIASKQHNSWTNMISGIPTPNYHTFWSVWHCWWKQMASGQVVWREAIPQKRHVHVRAHIYAHENNTDAWNNTYTRYLYDVYVYMCNAYN